MSGFTRYCLLTLNLIVFSFLADHTLAQVPAPNKTTHYRSAKDVLRAYVTAWNQHDFYAIKSLMAPDGFHEDASSLNSRATGPAQTEQLLRDMIKIEPDFDWHLTNVIESGPFVAAEWVWTGTYTGASPGGFVVAKQISGRGATFAVIENGQIKRLTDFYDPGSYFPKKSDTLE